MEGWIQLHRQIRENWLWSDPVKLKWWIDLLMEANHKDQEVAIGFKVFKCSRGQTIKSLKTWAQRWRVSKSVVRNFLTMLEKQHMIRTENETVTTRITICKYDSYQTNQNGNGTETERIKNALRTQGDPNNNGNNDNNEKKTFKPPTQKAVFDYLKNDKHLKDFQAKEISENFINFYESKNWMVGKNKMKIWKSAATSSIKWERHKSLFPETSKSTIKF